MNRNNVALTAIAVLLGAAIGVGSYTFIYAKGYSYLSNDPAACTNCHVMRGYYEGWVKGSHHAAAACNDCHTPHTLAAKYAVKTSNGFLHSLAFTTGFFPYAIQIRARNQRVTEASCRRCHEQMVTAIDSPHRDANATTCVRCHAGVGHGDSVMSAAPQVMIEAKRIQP